ncbi:MULTISPECIES: restriction endonuclease subunit S [Niastella]|uniref:Restriction endonuclease subunit S n=1 Tax=Niastella soli TaxID=2821487 RepID=A0ABS3Z203_9BACT|nr:restriction endonuclease subunit S [Niastella soli]MBO9204197.1 restriction endonuclease subunit S [Niastella soli]
MNNLFFEDIVRKDDGFLRGPFGGALKKEIFVNKGANTFKVYEQGVVLNKNDKLGNYYITEEYYNSSMKRFNAKPGDILVSCSGVNYGAIYQLPNDAETGVINQALLRIRLNNEIVNDRYFLYYFESYIVNKIIGGTGDSTIPNFPPMTVVRRVPIELPDLPTQQKIAAILSALDDKIELNNRINAELEQIAKTLYDYWFVQFDFPDENKKPYKSSGGKMSTNAKLKMDLPKGWEVKNLSEISSELVRGISPKYSNDFGIPVINQRCIRNNTIDFAFCRVHDIQLKPITKVIKLGDILVNSTGVGTLGRVALVKRLENPQTTCDSHVTIVRANFNEVNSLFLGISLLNKQSEIEKLGEGSTGQTELSRENLGKLLLTLPKRELQNKFELIVKPLFEKIAINEKQNKQLSTLRSWLLPMLMNGQVKVGSSSMSTKKSAKATRLQARNEKTVELNIPANKVGFAKQVLAGKIVSKFIDDPNFTDIKFQKIQFLAEHIVEADLNLNYYCQAAGPYDNKFMHTIYNDFRKQQWFAYQDKQFIPLEKQDKIEGYYQGYFASAEDQLNKLFELLYHTSEAEAEIIATIYAVCNNRIIERRTTADEELINDFYLWSDRKKKYTKEQVSTGLQWLRKHQLEPRGFGKLIKKATGKS